MRRKGFTPLEMRFLTGFTLIELVVVVTILAILAAVAIPTFGNLQKQAKDAATEGAVGAMREAIQQYRMNEITSGRQPGTAGIFPNNGCPGGTEIQDFEQNSLGSKVMLNGDNPNNPWAEGVVPAGNEDYVTLAISKFVSPKGTLGPFFPQVTGWVYNQASCDIWANTNVNGETPCNPCTAGCKTENCF